MEMGDWIDEKGGVGRIRWQDSPYILGQILVLMLI